MGRHDIYSIYLMFAVVAQSPDALECPGKYVYHELVTDTQCDRRSGRCVLTVYRYNFFIFVRRYGFPDLEPSLPLPWGTPGTRIRESSYRRCRPYDRRADCEV